MIQHGVRPSGPARSHRGGTHEMEPGNTPAPGYGELLSHPSPNVASDFDAWFFLFWAGLLVVVIALPWAIGRLVRHKDGLPLIFLGAGLMTSLGEPMLDL